MSPKTGANILAVAAATTFGLVTYACTRPAIENAYLQSLYANHQSVPLSEVFRWSFAWAGLYGLGVCVGTLTLMNIAIDIVHRKRSR